MSNQYIRVNIALNMFITLHLSLLEHVVVVKLLKKILKKMYNY